MAAFSAATIISAIGVAATVGSIGVGLMQSQQAKKQAELSKQSEAVRQQQMNLDAMRKKRDIIRQAQVASAQSQAIASAQGASESSAAAGALSSIAGQAGVNTLGVSQNAELGNRLFDINKQKADSYSTSASLSSLSTGLSSLGGLLTKNAGTIAQVGTYLAGKS